MAADRATPNTRNGSACTHTATNTVAHVCNAGAVRCGASTNRPTASKATRAMNAHGSWIPAEFFVGAWLSWPGRSAVLGCVIALLGSGASSY
ncbi:hypothetical protein H4W80_002436 [Nonomuraea angiospora]|uniref:Uncharacterized protein n=1 Tax=Nonomuraea angiospora TaxID=46172 RepID=A0ABR9LU42_9ACTN|nr:hypothetical protein [Nonomuraea angiospora]